VGNICQLGISLSHGIAHTGITKDVQSDHLGIGIHLLLPSLNLLRGGTWAACTARLRWRSPKRRNVDP
jgi:hypothetical protein